MKIFKYELFLGKTTLNVPRHCKFLSTQYQDGYLQIWALVDPEAEKVDIHAHVVGTGHPLTEKYFEMKYMGTVQNQGFVWHVFLENVK